MLSRIKKIAKTLWSDQSGATAIEYGLIAALIAVVIIVALTALGTDLRNMFNQVAASI